MEIISIIPILNQFDIARQAIKFLLDSGSNVLVIDNGSDEEFTYDDKRVEVVRYDYPLGSYRVYFEALNHSDADILAFFHSDFFVYDKDWVDKVLKEFERDSKLGMIGFVGAKGIGADGGRIGTMSNFQGKIIESDPYITSPDNTIDVKNKWGGSPAEIHGARITSVVYSGVVDGCSMILRKDALEDIGFRDNICIHHFYDKIISCQLIEKGWKICTYGISCDHISGQTANTQDKYQLAVKEWFKEKGLKIKTKF